MLRVGDIFYGYCDGYFGSDSSEDKIVVGMGHDWIVVSDVYFDNTSGRDVRYPVMAHIKGGIDHPGNYEMIEKWKAPEEEQV